MDSADATTSADTVDAADAATEDKPKAGPSTAVPLPAETIGKAKGRSAGSSASTSDTGRSSDAPGSRQTDELGGQQLAVGQDARDVGRDG